MIPNDVDIEMAEAEALSNQIHGVYGTPLNVLKVGWLTRQIGLDLYHGYTDSPSYALVCWLEDEGLTCTPEQFDEICWDAHEEWQRLERENA